MLTPQIVGSFYQLLMEDDTFSKKDEFNIFEHFAIFELSIYRFNLSKKTINGKNCYQLVSDSMGLDYTIEISDSNLSWFTEDDFIYTSSDFFKSFGFFRHNDNGDYRFSIEKKSSIFKNFDILFSCHQYNINQVSIQFHHLDSVFIDYIKDPNLYNNMFNTLLSLCIESFDDLSIELKFDLKVFFKQSLNIEVDMQNKSSFEDSVVVLDMILI